MAWGNKDELEPPVPGVPRSSPSNGSSGKLSFVGGEVTLTGNLSGQGDLHLDGAVEGDINCNTLILGQSGRVKGNVVAEKATLGGTVGGTVNAHTLIIEKSAKINGDLTYENITIETGASVDGRLSKRANKAGASASSPVSVASAPSGTSSGRGGAAVAAAAVPDQGLKLVAENE